MKAILGIISCLQMGSLFSSWENGDFLTVKMRKSHKKIACMDAHFGPWVRSSEVMNIQYIEETSDIFLSFFVI